MAKSAVISAIIAAAVTASAFVFNPSPEQHRTKIKQVISERDPMAGALGLGVLTAFMSSYHSLGVASYTTVDDETMSVGALGVVVVLEPKQKSKHKE